MKKFSYAKAGVDIDASDAVKRRMAKAVDVPDRRVLNRSGAFASVVEGTFSGIGDPVLVLKTEEPGSKQLLALQARSFDTIAQDLIHHLVNDVAVMGAHPMYVLDCIVCGELQPDVVESLVRGMAGACRALGCVLVGGETSIQPRVIPAGSYVLSATAVGVADRLSVIDGSSITPGDAVLAVESNGFHTNGYTLIRTLLDENPDLADTEVDGQRFLDVALRPHLAYYPALRTLFGTPAVHGLAHVTGGGIQDNLGRILPESIAVQISLSDFPIPSIYRLIRESGRVSDRDMLRTFNMGCGLLVVCASDAAEEVRRHFNENDLECWQIGQAKESSGGVSFSGELAW